MNTNETILQWFDKILVQFPWIYFKYEFSNEKNIYYISVYPSNLVDENEEYCKAENEFSIQLYKLFPNDRILFGTEEELFKCSENALIIKGKQIVNETFSAIISGFSYKPKNELSYIDSYSYSDSYLLAA